MISIGLTPTISDRGVGWVGAGASVAPPLPRCHHRAQPTVRSFKLLFPCLLGTFDIYNNERSLFFEMASIFLASLFYIMGISNGGFLTFLSVTFAETLRFLLFRLYKRDLHVPT